MSIPITNVFSVIAAIFEFCVLEYISDTSLWKIRFIVVKQLLILLRGIYIFTLFLVEPLYLVHLHHTGSSIKHASHQAMYPSNFLRLDGCESFLIAFASI